MNAARRLRSRRNRPRLRWLVLIAIVAGVLAWALGFLAFVNGLPRAANDRDPSAPVLAATYDAIIVLTGGSGRLEAGLTLLAAGRANKMLVSGVYHGVDVATLLKLSQTAPRDLDCCIVLGYTADNTTGNAVESAAWIATEGYRSLLLVTANYHLPRSLIEFRSAMPDIEIAAWPVHPPKVEIDAWWHRPGTAKLLAGEYTKFLAAKLRIWLRNRRHDIQPAWLS